MAISEEVKEIIERERGQVKEDLYGLAEILPLTSPDELVIDGTLIGSRAFEYSLAGDWEMEGTQSAITSRWIGHHLGSENGGVGRDYQYRMWKRYNVFRVRMVRQSSRKDLPVGATRNGLIRPVQSYSSFRGTVSTLRQAGLVDYETTKEHPDRGGEDRHYLEAVVSPENEGWFSPRDGVYPGSTPGSMRNIISHLEEQGVEPTPEAIAEVIDVEISTVVDRLESWDMLDTEEGS